MINIKKDFEHRDGFVLIPEKDFVTFERFIEDLEDKIDTKEFLDARLEGEETLPMELIESIHIDGINPVLAYRKHRGYTQKELSKRSKVSQNMISQIENGEREGKLSILKAIAKALDVDLDMLAEFL